MITIMRSLTITNLKPKNKKRGRPSTNFDKKAYQRQYMADKRHAEKLGVSVRKYRASEAKRRMENGLS